MRPLLAVVAFLLALIHFENLQLAERTAEAATRVSILYGAATNDTVPLWIAKEQGFLRKYGIDADIVFVIGGQAVQAMVADQVQFGLIGAAHVTNAVTAGADLSMILGMRNSLPYIFVAQPFIKGAEGLRGKKIGTGTLAGPVSLAVYMVLDHYGLDPRRDNIVVFQVGGVGERLAAMRARTIEATPLPPELARVAISEGYTVLLDFRKENVPFPFLGLVSSRKFMKSNPALVEDIAKAIIESVAYVHNSANKKTTMASMARNLRLHDKPEILEAAYQDLLLTVSRKPCPNLQGAATALRLMAEYGINPKASQLKPNDIVDMSLCKRLDESGFFDRLYQQK
jgi:ABC-type nitrate/sulfonate/bicarbonate transport system substrate-binding protein